MNKKQTTENQEHLQERVPVIIHRPEGEKKDFRTVTVNGRNFQIEYDRQVMLPRYAAEVIEESERNSKLANDNARAKAEDFENGKSALEF